MILYPNCKINLGLDILRRRGDGYHDLETIMIPVRGLCDILEIVRSEGDKQSGVSFSSSGIAIDCPPDKNICIKAYRLMSERYGIGPVRMHLHKTIPFGAGLGGGSSDGAFAIKGLDEIFSLGLSIARMEELAAEIGSDTPFFIPNTTQLATGRGEILSPVELPLRGKTLLIVKPDESVSTAEAYSGVKPHETQIPLSVRSKSDIGQWKELITNDFERHIFATHPEIGRIKNTLYDLGAQYASMSGSGSAVYGIFRQTPVQLADAFPGLFVYQEIMS